MGQTVEKVNGTSRKRQDRRLEEDEFLFKSYEVDGLLKKVEERLTCRSKEIKRIGYIFSFEDTNKMFELSGLNFECVY